MTERGRPAGKEPLVDAARRLFAEKGVEAVSLREVVRAAGHRNTNAVQYHFGDRSSLLAAVVEPFEMQVGARRAALLDELESTSEPPMRGIAGALVRPSAAMLEHAEGREYLRIAAQLIYDMDEFTRATKGAGNNLERWNRLAKANMAGATFSLHRRYSAISLCFTTLGRRAATRRRPDHRLFVSDLVDLVTGVLEAAVSDETDRLLQERDAGRTDDLDREGRAAAL